MLGFKKSSTVWHLPLMALLLLIISTIPMLFQQYAGMPSKMDQTGWTVLKRITREPHPYNSNENLLVRQYLIDQIEQIKSNFDSRNCSQVNPIQITTDDINLYYGKTYYESNNVMVKFMGNHSESLLISSHFDSTPTSHGATDAGIGIASMVSVLEKLSIVSCHEQLKYSLLFNFNNAEEYYLYGGASFTKHALFKDAKAFINLEGTGAAESQPAALFRTNSPQLTNLLMQKQPYPHASVIFNSMMKYVHSDTDYRVYSTVGGLPGVDIAFYSFRYLYHSPLDDIEHVSPKSVGQMIENVYASALAIVRHPTLLKDIKLDKSLKSKDPNSELPVPPFSFFDRFGYWGIFQSKWSFISAHTILLICISSAVMLKCLSAFFWNGRHSLWQHLIKPSINSLLLVIATVLFTFLVNFVFSGLRTWINPGITYGKPELVIATVFILTFVSICTIQLVWVRIAKRLRLVNVNTRYESIYDPLPISSPLRDDASSLDEEELVEEQVPLSPESYDTSRSSIDSDEMDVRPQTAPRKKKDRAMTVWLPVGICGFWTVMLVLSLVASANGVSALYFLYDFAMFSSISVMVTIIFDQIYKKLLHEDMNFEYSVHEQRFLAFYENHFWLVQLLISAPVPTMFFIDVFKQIYLGLPSLVGEGIPDYQVDLAFTFLVFLMMINFMPVLSRSNRRNSIFVCLVVLFGIWIPQLFLFPFTETRPYRYTFTERVDITNSTTAQNSKIAISSMAIGNPDRWVTYLEQHNVHVPTYTIKDNMVLFEHPSDITDVDLIQIAMQKETNGDVYMRGSVIGSPGSRFCTIKTPQKVISSYIDKQTNWIDYYEKQGTESHIKVLKRSFNHGKDRIKFDYGFIVAKNTTDFSVTVECLHGTESSGFYKELKKAPRWMHDTGRNGFYISKTIALQ